jgi:hypothetical protein
MSCREDILSRIDVTIMDRSSLRQTCADRSRSNTLRESSLQWLKTVLTSRAKEESHAACLSVTRRCETRIEVD